MSPSASSAASFAGRKVVVVGLGQTGLSCVRWLHAQGAMVAVADTRENPPGLVALREAFSDVAVVLGALDAATLCAADEIVLSPGMPLATPALQEALARGLPVRGDADLFGRAAAAPVIAITGSNGKSTVTTLVGRMAREAGLDAAAGGNLGTPMLDLLRPDAALYVLELSSFQLEATHHLPARAATVLNLSADHLDRYRSFTDYAAAKARIYRQAECAVINHDDHRAAALADGVAERIGFSLGAPADERDYGILELGSERWLARGAEPLMPAAEVRLAGRHNLANALAALALAEVAGVAPAAACEVLAHFTALAHRSEVVAERRGVRWIDDSKGTNPGATVAALTGLVPEAGATSTRAVLIAGGDGKGADFSALADAVRGRARAVILIGRDAARIERALRHTGVPLLPAADMEIAVRTAAATAEPGDCVLLSPACASFDMFDDYRHRGRVFAEAVTRLTP